MSVRNSEVVVQRSVTQGQSATRSVGSVLPV